VRFWDKTLSNAFLTDIEAFSKVTDMTPITRRHNYIKRMEWTGADGLPVTCKLLNGGQTSIAFASVGDIDSYGHDTGNWRLGLRRGFLNADSPQEPVQATVNLNAVPTQTLGKAVRLFEAYRDARVHDQRIGTRERPDIAAEEEEEEKIQQSSLQADRMAGKSAEEPSIPLHREPGVIRIGHPSLAA
jgi:hypothetical protein